ncbi:hypothetical protein G3A43_09235 [Paraburkholderia aspalathi]|nr:hypothetical protein [Paraburkholderia aspalathi]MBK3780413.1 hypothetical protein [Paraburkholderia aspalathi]
MSKKTSEKSWQEIGATVGAALDLASYAASKMGVGQPGQKPEPKPEVMQSAVPAEPEKSPSKLLVACCVLIAVVGIAGLLLLPKSAEPPVAPVCQFAHVAQSPSGASGAVAPTPASAQPLNMPCRIPYHDPLTPGEHIAGSVIKAVIFGLL